MRHLKYKAMDFFSVILLFLFSTCIQPLKSQENEAKRGYFLIAPKQLLTNRVEKVCGFLHNLQELEGIVALELRSTNTNIITSVRRHIFKGENHFCLELLIPNSYTGEAFLSVEGIFGDTEKSSKYAFQKSEKIAVKHPTNMLFIETDKPLYKAGDMVRIRVLHVTAELKPVNDPFAAIWIEDPSNVRVAQWLNQKSEGLFDLQMKISTEPVLGIWNVKVETQYEIKTQSFEVQNYVLPKFEVKISSPDFILANEEKPEWKICAYYSYGKPVKGRAMIKIVKTRNKDGVSSEQDTWKIYEGKIEGCQEVVGILPAILRKFGTNEIGIHALVTEKGTDETMTAFDEIKIHYEPYLLDLKSYNQEFIKPGLPYFGKVKVMTPDFTPVSNISVDIQIEFNFDYDVIDSKAKTYISDEKGFITFSTLLTDNDRQWIKIKAKSELPSYSTSLIRPSTSIVLTTSKSPSRSHLQIIRPDLAHLPCEGEFTFTIFHTEILIDVPIYYQVIVSRSNIIHSSVSIINSRNADFVDENYLGGNEENVNKNLQAFDLTVPLSPKMMPMSRLLVFYIRKDGEIVSDTLEFNLDKCIRHKVDLTFEPKQVLPATSTTLHVKADPHSFCGLGVLDKAISFLRSSNRLTFDKVLSKLSELNVKNPYWDCYDPCEDRIMCETKNFDGGFWQLFPADMTTAFKNAGVVVLSDLLSLSYRCPYALMRSVEFDYAVPDDYTGPANIESHIASSDFNHELLLSKNVVVKPANEVKKTAVEIRNHFPETWLWKLEKIGSSGEIFLPLEAPHSVTSFVGHAVCLSRVSGLGLSAPAHLEIFQPFFISCTLPYSVKRGETFPLIISVYNYLNKCLPIKLSLDKSDQFSLVNATFFTKFCLCQEESITVQFRLRPKSLGHMNMTVYAYTSTPDICANVSSDFISMEQARDAITKSVIVEAEGFPNEKVWNSLLCPSDGKIVKEGIHLSLPETPLVPGTARGFVTVFGDLMGSSVQGLDHLVRQPTGCGEQNMVLFTPNIYVMDYLKLTKQLTPELEKKIISHLETGYQRELTYKHPDGSYSAFGVRDSQGSIWLTAFVVKSFAKAKPYIFIDDKILNKSIDWIISNQLENGCYPFVGSVLTKSMKGGIGHSEGSLIALTAYITIALLEAGVPSTDKAITDAFFCLKSEKDPDVYTLVLSAFAAALVNESDYSEDLFNRLDGFATANDNLLHWKTPRESKSLSVEMTAYALLTYLVTEKDKLSPLKIVRWLTQQQNSHGGFVSTQDTVLALQALSQFATKYPSHNIEVDVKLETSTLDRAFHVNDENKLLQQKMILPHIPEFIELSAQGSGCVMIQAVLRYNILQVTGSDAFGLHFTTEKVGTIKASCKKNRLRICTRYKLRDKQSNMAVVEIQMISGFEPDKESILKMSAKKEIKLKRWEIEKDQLNLYFDKLDAKPKCFSFQVNQIIEVEDLKPAIIKVYDYYQPELFITGNYSLTGCQIDPLPEFNETELSELEASIITDLDDLKDLEIKENILSSETYDDIAGNNEQTEKLIPDPIFVHPLGKQDINAQKNQRNIHHLQDFRPVVEDRDFPEGLEGVLPVRVSAPPSFKTNEE